MDAYGQALLQELGDKSKTLPSQQPKTQNEIDEVSFNNQREKTAYENELLIEKYRNYLKRAGLEKRLLSFDMLSTLEKVAIINTLHPTFKANIDKHPKPKLVPKYRTNTYNTYDHKTGETTIRHEEVFIGYSVKDSIDESEITEDCDDCLCDNLPKEENLIWNEKEPSSKMVNLHGGDSLPTFDDDEDLVKIDSLRPHPVRVKNPLTTAVMYSFRFPLGDGSYMFYIIREDGLYENMQTKVVKSIDQLLRMLNKKH